MHFLGKNIRYLRKLSGETQTGLGSMFDKGQTTIGNWENGISEPNIGELLTLSNFFDIPIDILIKVDLAQTNWKQAKQPEDKKGRGRRKPVVYQHDAGEENIAAEPSETGLSYIMHKLKSMEEEIASLKDQLNK